MCKGPPPGRLVGEDDKAVERSQGPPVLAELWARQLEVRSQARGAAGWLPALDTYFRSSPESKKRHLALPEIMGAGGGGRGHEAS